GVALAAQLQPDAASAEKLKVAIETANVHAKALGECLSGLRPLAQEQDETIKPPGPFRRHSSAGRRGGNSLLCHEDPPRWRAEAAGPNRGQLYGRAARYKADNRQA